MPKPIMWLCASWKPGSTVAPRRSTTRSASFRRSRLASSASIRPPAMATADARGRSGFMVSTLALTSARSVTASLAGQQGRDRGAGEPVADDPALALGDDRLAGAQVAQRLGHGGVVDSGRGGQVGDADRAGRLDTGEQGEPGGIAEHGEVASAGLDRVGVESGDGLADPFGVDDPVIGPVRGQQVHRIRIPHPGALTHPGPPGARTASTPRGDSYPRWTSCIGNASGITSPHGNATG